MKGKLKKIKSMAVSAALITGLAFSHAAGVGAAALISPPDTPLPIMISGKIASETGDMVEVKPYNEAEMGVMLNMGAYPYVVDCATGEAAALKDRIDDSVIAYYGPVTTRSIPPQSNPVLIIINIPQDYIPPKYGRAEAVEKSGDSVKVTMDNGSLIVTFAKDTPISPYLTRNIVTIDNIQVGSDLLVWTPMVAMSYPAQANAQKAVLLGQTNSTETRVEMTALRTAAEELGYKVDWDDFYWVVSIMDAEYARNRPQNDVKPSATPTACRPASTVGRGSPRSP